MNRRLKQIEDKLEQCTKTVDTNTEKIKEVEKKVEGLSSELKKEGEKTVKLVKQGERSVYEEMRERETRRLNVVFFGIAELNEREATGKDKMAWDRKSCCNIFEALRLDMGEEAVKFCRRVGEKGEGPRPLVAGLWTEADRAKLLKNAKKLEDTVFSDVSVGIDLTKVQREEEKEMKKEADRRNTQLAEQDKSKNLQWLVVGARGEKRIIKAVPREQPAQRGRPTGRGRGTTTRRGGRGNATGANTIPMGPRQGPTQTPPEAETVEEEVSDEEMEETEETETEPEEHETATDRATTKKDNRLKRKGSGGRAWGAPPEKR
jgi:predicted phage tail protein